MKHPRKSLSILQLLQPVADRFIATLEAHIEREARILAGQLFAAAREERKTASANGRRRRLERVRPLPGSSKERPRTRKGRTSPAPDVPPARMIAAPPPDPKEVERIAELRRLRSILRPKAEAPIAPRPSAQPPAPGTSGHPVRALEDEVRDAVPFLSTLPPVRWAAQIAVWAGRARLYQEHPSDGRSRIAAELLIEKLRGLARAMEVGRIDALDPFVTRDWRRYVEENEATARGEGGTARPGGAGEVSSAPDYSSVWE